MSGAPDPLPVSYATATAEGVAAFVGARYGLAGPTCTFLNRGFNDCYAVDACDGARFVLRVSGERARGPADVAAETAFLAHLDAAGVPVAAAVPTRDGALFTTAPLPCGPRAAVLFRYAEGRRPGLDDPEDAGRQGVTLARIHDAADRYPGRDGGRQRLDLDHLLHRQAAAVLALGLAPPQARADFAALVERLAEELGRLDPTLARTRCHGDCHGLNARIATAGPRAGQAVFFDFDDGGFGYLAYDLAVHLWAQVSFGRRRHAVWRAFRAGYGSVRTVAAPDEAAVPWFVPVRHIWLMGEYAGRLAEWGHETLSGAWLEREVAFLLDWERDRLGPALF